MYSKDVDFLIAEYLFGTIDEDNRFWLEEKLLKSPNTLERLLIIKREMDINDELSLKPNSEIKLQISQALFKDEDKRSIFEFVGKIGFLLNPRVAAVASIILLLISIIFVNNSRPITEKNENKIESLVDMGPQDFNTIDFL